MREGLVNAITKAQVQILPGWQVRVSNYVQDAYTMMDSSLNHKLLRSTMYKIMGKYDGTTEEVDTADSEETARYLEREYQLAYGYSWEVWVLDPDGNTLD